VNIAFPQSFGRKENARKAILKRGWNPLNYVLLDHPKLIRSDSDSPTAEESTQTGNSASTNVVSETTTVSDPSTGIMTIVTGDAPPISINTTGKTKNKFVDLFANNKARSEGAKRKIEQENKDREKRAKQLEELMEICAVTSGQLCLGNHWILNNTVCEAMQVKADIDNEKKKIVNEKKATQAQKEADKFHTSTIQTK
jgi:hypothetical protein